MQLGTLTLQCCSPGVGGGEGRDGAGRLGKRKAAFQARGVKAEEWQ